MADEETTTVFRARLTALGFRTYQTEGVMTDDDGRDEVPGLPVGGWVGAGDGSDVDADTPIAEPACPSCGRPVGPDLCRCDPWRDESDGPVG